MEVSFACPLRIGRVVSGLSYFVCNFKMADIPCFKNLSDPTKFSGWRWKVLGYNWSGACVWLSCLLPFHELHHWFCPGLYRPCHVGVSRCSYPSQEISTTPPWQVVLHRLVACKLHGWMRREESSTISFINLSLAYINIWISAYSTYCCLKEWSF
jgi:hypothetical protein